jgi:hypothetical protein
MYLAFCEENSHIAIKRNQFDLIIKAVGPQAQSLLAALDSVNIKCGTQNFKDYNNLIIFITKGRLLLQHKLLKRSREVESYIKKDLKHHLTEHSAVKSHCFDHLLGPLNGTREGNCDKVHETICPHCSAIHLLKEDINLAINTMSFDQNPPGSTEQDLQSEPSEDDPESKASLICYATKLHQNLDTYWAHTVRSVQDKNQLQSMIDSLEDGEVLIISDWKMKMQALYFRESMVMFFSKRGIPWFGTMMIRKKRSEEMETHQGSQYVTTFTDVLIDNTPEDGPAVAAVLEHILKEYKIANPEINRAKLFTDGAGCFTSSFLLIFLTQIGKLTNIRITDVFISEAGCGKTALDTHFGIMRVHIIKRVLAGQGANDITDATSCVITASTGKLVGSTNIKAMKLEADPAEAKAIPQVRDMMHRTYTFDAISGECVSVVLRSTYNRGKDKHVLPEFQAETKILELLRSEDALKVFLPRTWTGVNGIPPITLKTLDTLPAKIKPPARPINPKLFENAKKEFERLKTYFYRPSDSPISSPLCLAAKATEPFIRFCGDYSHTVNPHMATGHYPIPNVRQSLEKIIKFPLFLDFDLTNGFHQFLLSEESSRMLSVQTP